jgi:protein-tyrosine phosphatase
MSEILPGLWVCNRDDVTSYMFLRATKATHILNCAEEFHGNLPAATLGLCVKRIPMIDDEDSSSYQQILEGAELLNQWIHPSNVILVHCAAGVSRSPTVVIAWLILYKGYAYDKAYDLVVKKRNFICPNPFFTLILKSLEKKQT